MKKAFFFLFLLVSPSIGQDQGGEQKTQQQGAAEQKPDQQQKPQQEGGGGGGGEQQKSQGGGTDAAVEDALKAGEGGSTDEMTDAEKALNMGRQALGNIPGGFNVEEPIDVMKPPSDVAVGPPEDGPGYRPLYQQIDREIGIADMLKGKLDFQVDREKEWARNVYEVISNYQFKYNKVLSDIHERNHKAKQLYDLRQKLKQARLHAVLRNNFAKTSEVMNDLKLLKGGDAYDPLMAELIKLQKEEDKHGKADLEPLVKEAHQEIIKIVSPELPCTNDAVSHTLEQASEGCQKKSIGGEGKEQTTTEQTTTEQTTEQTTQQQQQKQQQQQGQQQQQQGQQQQQQGQQQQQEGQQQQQEGQQQEGQQGQQQQGQQGQQQQGQQGQQQQGQQQQGQQQGQQQQGQQQQQQGQQQQQQGQQQQQQGQQQQQQGQQQQGEEEEKEEFLEKKLRILDRRMDEVLPRLKETLAKLPSVERPGSVLPQIPSPIVPPPAAAVTPPSAFPWELAKPVSEQKTASARPPAAQPQTAENEQGRTEKVAKRTGHVSHGKEIPFKMDRSKERFIALEDPDYEGEDKELLSLAALKAASRFNEVINKLATLQPHGKPEHTGKSNREEHEHTKPKQKAHTTHVFHKKETAQETPKKNSWRNAPVMDFEEQKTKFGDESWQTKIPHWKEQALPTSFSHTTKAHHTPSSSSSSHSSKATPVHHATETHKKFAPHQQQPTTAQSFSSTSTSTSASSPEDEKTLADAAVLRLKTKIDEDARALAALLHQFPKKTPLTAPN